MIFALEFSTESIEKLMSERLRKLQVNPKKRNNFYDKESLDDLQDNDELRGSEQGFMYGYIDSF